MTGEPGCEVVKLVDFGLVQILSKESMGQLPVTEKYICPQGTFGDELETLVACMLAKDPDNRPQNMSQVKMSLFQCAMALQETYECRL